jgi:hypothetical protein
MKKYTLTLEEFNFLQANKDLVTEQEILEGKFNNPEAKELFESYFQTEEIEDESKEEESTEEEEKSEEESEEEKED